MRMNRILSILIAVVTLGGVPSVAAAQTPVVIDVMVFSETAGFRHSSISSGIAMFQNLAASETLANVDFSVTSVGNSVGHFTAANLAKFDVVVWLSTTGDVLDDTEEAAFEGYIENGGGYLGIHAAADTEYTWPWYYDLVGAQFKSHPAIDEATIDVENRQHISTAHLPERWTRTDEWYNYKRNPRSYVCNSDEEAPGVETGELGTYVAIFFVGVDIPEDADPREKNCGVNVLLSLDESTYTNNNDAMGDHPIAWCNEWAGGRAFYTGLGHTDASYTDPNYIRHVTGGLLAAAGTEGTTCEAKA